MTDLTSSVGSSWADYLKVLLVLGGILLVAVVTLRFWLPRMRGWNRGGAGPVAVLGQFALEPKKTLYVVRAGKAVLLMGSSDAGLQFITMLDGTGFDESFAAPVADPAPWKFGRVLESVRNRNRS